jgi:ATP-binding cassette, subfamily F, member 3
MITIKNIKLSFSQQIVFDEISCVIKKENKIGLVGRNGSGKSTLLKVVAKLQNLDEGEIAVERGATIGYMPQEVTLSSTRNVFDEAFTVFEVLSDLVKENEKLEAELHEHEPDESVVERYAIVHQELNELNYEKRIVETKKILMGLGFSEEQLNVGVDKLSIGWRMRVVLAKLLLQKADFYLFDEPTNHLDIVAKDWFLGFLKKSNFGFILVCHDRYFLDHLCTKVLELEMGAGTIFHGNYSKFLIQKEEQTQALEKASERQKKEIASKMKTVERFRASASKSKMAQSLEKSVKKIERIKVVSKPKTVAFRFPEIERSGKIVLTVNNVSHSFPGKKVFENVSFEVERGEKVAIIAPNGVGKTTLFNTITGRYDVQNGSIDLGYNASTALFEQNQDDVLNPKNTILDEVEGACRDSETRKLVRGFLGAFLFSGDDVYKRIRVLSGGEKNRVAMVKVLLQRANLLLLDEPTNHLDLQSKEVLLNALRQFKGTVLFVSHDRDFLDKLSTRILELKTNGLTSYPGNYESFIYHKDKSQLEKEEKINKTDKKSKTSSDHKKDYESRKRAGKLESKIGKLEKEIVELNKKLEALEYGTKEFKKCFDRLQVCQQSLDECIEEWEELLH